MSDTTTAMAKPETSKRQKILRVIATIFALIGLGWWLDWALFARYVEETDDAYVQGNVVQITPQIAGTVTQIYADDTDVVKPGQVLMRLDTGDVNVALAQAEAALAQTVRQVRTLYASTLQGNANLTVRQTELKRAQDDLVQRQRLAGTGAIAEEEIRHAQSTVVAAKAAVAVAQEQLTANQALTRGTSVAQHPNVQGAAARVREALLAQERTTLYAPIGGQVVKRNAQVGQRVNAGTPAMAIVAPDQLWVDANFKEGQLRKMQIGQPVTLTADLYGSQVEYSGKVVGFAAGTGAAFALLPAQNATGNWIKVVQRVPVRIALDAKQLAAHPLRIGLSMHVEVNLHKQVSTSANNQQKLAPTLSVYTDPLATFNSKAQAKIDALIAANLK